MEIGIVGLPNVGKSTLFAALTRQSVDINNYPFCTIEPNVGVVSVPDERLDALAEWAGSARKIPAAAKFTDIAGLVKGANTGEGLGNRFLANIRQVAAIVQVVRVFRDDNITHVHDRVDPERDIQVVETELILADLATVEKSLSRAVKLSRGGDREAAAIKEVLEKVKRALEEGKPVRSLPAEEIEPAEKFLRELSLLTAKPVLYVFNRREGDVLSEKLRRLPHIDLDIKLELELAEMTPQEREEFGLRSHLGDLITAAYDLLELEVFFTVGEKESRAWTIKKGSTAPEAGGAIHSDFREKFIRAEAIAWDQLLKFSSRAEAREAGKLRLVGKDYLVRDGDVLEFFI